MKGLEKLTSKKRNALRYSLSNILSKYILIDIFIINEKDLFIFLICERHSLHETALSDISIIHWLIIKISKL